MNQKSSYENLEDLNTNFKNMNFLSKFPENGQNESLNDTLKEQDLISNDDDYVSGNQCYSDDEQTIKIVIGYFIFKIKKKLYSIT